MSEIVLYDYPKSSASYRVRIALNLAGLAYRAVQVDLLAGAQSAPEHLALNPQGFVPVLEIDGHRLTQSLAIVDYLDATREMGLLPSKPVARAKAKALAMAIAIDIHPICNVSVAAFATGGKEPERTDWMRHFIGKGLTAFEGMLAKFGTPRFSTGDTPGLADICLIPQLYNADRWGASLDDMPRIRSIRAACDALPAFADAHPDYRA
jgi:maleylacetoacetate isomerase